jgi:hypothetical protein
MTPIRPKVANAVERGLAKIMMASAEAPEPRTVGELAGEPLR